MDRSPSWIHVRPYLHFVIVMQLPHPAPHLTFPTSNVLKVDLSEDFLPMIAQGGLNQIKLLRSSIKGKCDAANVPETTDQAGF